MSYAGKTVAGRHDLTFGPVGLWQLNGNMKDSTGNGLDLAVEVGTERYTDILPKLRGFYFDGSTSIWRSTFDPILAIAGDVTVEFIALVPNFVTDKSFVSFGAAKNGQPVNNAQYEVGMPGTGLGMEMTWDTGNGNTIAYDTNDVFSVGTPFHLAMTRASNIVQFYLNGVSISPPSASLTGPTGGSSGRFRIGSNDVAQHLTGAMTSVKVLAFALSPAQITSEYNRTLGATFGQI